MSLSISSSEASARADRVRWLAVFAMTLGGGLAALYLLLVLVDPYETRRFPSLGISGIADESPRTANASRGSDPRFNAALLGTSTGQLLDPRRLSEATGLKFVQLTVPGSGPREQLTLLRWFVRHHESVGALVIASDEAWCTLDPALPLLHPFPFWLYGENLEYLANLLSAHSLSLAWRRIEVALHLRAPTDATGYADYETDRIWAFQPKPATAEPPAPGTIPDMSFPGVERLQDVVASLPATVPVVLVMPPAFYAALPQAGSEAAVRVRSCKTALAKVVTDRPRSAFIDFYVDGPIARDPINFMDEIHYRANVARHLEENIAATLQAGRLGDGTL